MEIETIRAFFGWCSVLNGALLIFTLLVCTFAGDWIYRMHSMWFPITRYEFNVALYWLTGVMKLIFLLFNLVPYIALVIVSQG